MQSIQPFPGREHGTTISNPITSPAGSIKPEPDAPLKAHLWKNTIKPVSKGLPTGELLCHCLEEKEIHLELQKTDILSLVLCA